ncbi:MAG: class III poly(R)-hydroxyalkanoic acid synthase subunit PhaC, partial [Gammaproteobacteria bacterium]|nr:class III poly(R)-hydroxyalkanoic acid synthase subunit PhaC [Gammaproteobacteria bacterium]
MFPFQIKPDDVSQEILDFNRKLAEGLNVLSELDEITVGTSEKEAVYEEDKLVLYHFKPRTRKQNPV